MGCTMIKITKKTWSLALWPIIKIKLNESFLLLPWCFWMRTYHVTFMVHTGKSTQCVGPQLDHVSFHPWVSPFAPLAFHHACSKVYSFLLRSAFPSCSCVVKPVQCMTSISEVLKNISLCGTCCQRLSTKGLVGKGTLINRIGRLLCWLGMPVSLSATERERRPTQMGLTITSELNLAATQVALNQII